MKIAAVLMLAGCAGASPPVIESFTASPSVVSDGDTVHLTFAASGNASINGAKVSGSSLDVVVTADAVAGEIARPFTLTVTENKVTAQQTVVAQVLRLPAMPVITAPASLTAPQDALAIVAPEDGMHYGWQVVGATALSGDASAALSFHVSAPGTVQLTCVAANALGRTATSAPINISTQGAVIFAGGAGITGDADGPGPNARFSSLTALQRADDGTIYGLDHDTIRKVSPVGGEWQVSTLAGGASGCVNGTGSAAGFDEPHDLWLDEANQRVLVAEGGSLGRVRAVSFAGGVTTIIAATGDPAACVTTSISATIAGLLAVTIAPSNDIWGVDTMGQVWDFPNTTPVTTLATTSDTATLRFVNETLFMLDGTAACIRQAPSFACWVGGVAASIDGNGVSAGFTQPLGMSLSAQGLLVGDTEPATGGLVRLVDGSGNVTTVVGVANAERTTALALPIGALPSTIVGVADANGSPIISGNDALMSIGN